MEYENKRITDDEYLKPYEEYTRKDECKSACKKRAALKNAFDTRKFEIGLYWKRTTYFWLFISAIFVAYYHVVTSHDLCASKKETFPLLLAALGVFVSCCWFCVNKGSKYWQENWEKHVALLEDAIIGPLHKTTLDESNDCSCFVLKAERFSVSKINQLLSFVTILVWAYIFVDDLLAGFCSDKPCKRYGLVICIALIICIFFLFSKCRHGSKKNDRFSMSRQKSNHER